MLNIQQQIEDKLKDFMSTLSFNNLSPVFKLHYVAIKRKLLEDETLPQDILIQRAHKIKPLIRLHQTYDDSEKMYHNYTASFDNTQMNDILVWTKAIDITQSFLFNFEAKSIIEQSPGNPLPTGNLKKIAEFTCYHKYGGHYAFLRPGVDEVIQQLPKFLDLDGDLEYAFELKFASENIHDIYDAVLDRHISTVILYHVTDGLPNQIRNQRVIYKTK